MHVYHRVLTLADLPGAARAGATTIEELPASLRHLAFDRVIGLLGEAWVSFLRSLGDVLRPRDVGVVHVACDYVREVKPGALSVKIEVQQLGTSSVTLRLELVQDGSAAVHGLIVLARKDFAAVRAVPLLPDQRTALAAHLAEGAGRPQRCAPRAKWAGPSGTQTAPANVEGAPMSGLDNSQPIADKASLHEGHLDDAAKAMDDKEKLDAAATSAEVAKEAQASSG